MGILSNTLNASAGSRNNNGEITTAAPITLLVNHFRIGEDDEHDPLSSKFLGSRSSDLEDILKPLNVVNKKEIDSKG